MNPPFVPGYDSTQLLIVDRGKMSLWEGGKKITDSIPVHVGANGVTREKREGDMKTPIGRFPLGTAFGDEAHRKYARQMPYLLVEEGLECVDDPNSAHYDCFVTRRTKNRDWKSSEKMIEFGFDYALGVVIRYMGNGSCIFMHIGSGGTAGCVA